MDTKDFNIDDFITSTAPISEPTKPTEQGLTTLSTAKTVSVVPIPPSAAANRTSAKQRKASLDEYREAFMVAPKITDRQPVFVSREVRDKIDEIVRRFGERKMSVSGFLENLARHHMETYSEELEQWKRL